MYLFNRYNDMQTWIILLASIVGCMVIGVLFINAMKDIHPIRAVIHEIMDKSNKSEEARIKAVEKLRREQGNQSEIKFMYRLDIALEKGGLKRKIPFLNSEIFLLFNCIFFVIVSGIVKYLTGSTFFMLISIMLMIFVISIFLFVLVAADEKIIDQNILQFSDLLESYSSTSDDIIQIFDSTAPHVDEPLRTVLIECVTSARINGDISSAFQVMMRKVNHRKFNELIQNVEECSRNNADYGKVIRRSHESISIYISEKEVRKTTANQAKFNIVIIIGVFIATLYMVSGMINQNVLTFLYASSSGRIVLGFCSVIMLYTLWKLITLGEK